MSKRALFQASLAPLPNSTSKLDQFVILHYPKMQELILMVLLSLIELLLVLLKVSIIRLRLQNPDEYLLRRRDL